MKKKILALVMTAVFIIGGCSKTQETKATDAAAAVTEAASEAGKEAGAKDTTAEDTSDSEGAGVGAAGSSGGGQVEENADVAGMLSGKIKNGAASTAFKAVPQYEKETKEYDSKSEYFSGSTEILKITDSEHEELKKAVDSWFEDYYKKYLENCRGFEEQAQDENAEREKESDGDYYGFYYELMMNLTVTRCDNKLFSICISEYSYMGGAHGGTYIYGVTFDSATGELIKNETFDAQADSVKEYVLGVIDASSKEAKDMLFPEYRETINERFKNGMKDCDFWFDNRGLEIAFQQYDIAPYAAGIITFDVPYSELHGFDEALKPDEDFYYIILGPQGMGDFIDTDGDGVSEYVSVESVSDADNQDSFIIHAGNREFTAGEAGMYYYCLVYYIHSPGGDYFMTQLQSDNDWNDTCLFSASAGFKLLGEEDGSVHDLSDGHVFLHTRRDVFGTYEVKREYAFDSSGFTLLSKIDEFDNDPSENSDARGITLLRDLKYSRESGDYTNTEILKKGTAIYIISADDNNEAGFVTKDGIKGFFKYEIDEEHGRMVDGVDEYEVFDGMPYSG